MSSTSCICCSCSLRTSSLILGWFLFISSVTALVSNIVFLTTIPMMADDPNTDKDKLRIETSAAIGSSAIELLLVGLLLYGIHAKRPTFMLLYLVTQLVVLVLLAIGVVCITVLVFIYDIAAGFMVLGGGIFVFVLGCYIWDVFYSYYRELEG